MGTEGLLSNPSVPISNATIGAHRLKSSFGFSQSGKQEVASEHEDQEQNDRTHIKFNHPFEFRSVSVEDLLGELPPAADVAEPGTLRKGNEDLI